MHRLVEAIGRQVTAWLLSASLLFSPVAAAAGDWEFDLEVHGWLPIIETETGSGQKGKITRDDILDNLDLFGFSFVRARRGDWTLSTDFVYFKISDDEDFPLFPGIPDLAKLDKAGMQAWVIRPSLGYVVHESDKQLVELYGGARYLWIEVDATLDFDPIIPGDPSKSRKISPSDSNWDGIAGVRGVYRLTDKWFLPYSVNAGTGESDFTWEAQAAFGYRLKHFSAVAGWRYLYYDIGSDTLIKELSVNGPFAGVLFQW